MGRKIVAQKGSFTVSLPKKWVENNNLKAGNSLFVIENVNSLTYSINETVSFEKELSLEFEDFDTSLIRSTLASAYKEGYTKINLQFKEYYKFIELQDIIVRMVGFIIESSTNKSAIILNRINFENIDLEKNIDKLFSLIDYSFMVVQSLIYESNGSLDELLKLVDTSIQQRDYLLRSVFLLKQDGGKQALYSFVESLERINSGLKRMIEENKQDSSFKEVFSKQKFAELHTQFRKLRKIFSNHKTSEVIKLTKKLRSLKSKFYSLPSSYLLLSENLFVASSRLIPITFLKF